MVNERRDPVRAERRVRRVASAWMSAPFGAHLLGQLEPGPFAIDGALRAFAQPESRITPRPSVVRAA